jgi:hypothetical protein
MMQTLRTEAVSGHAGGENEIEIEIDVEPDIDSEIQAVLDDLTEWVEDDHATHLRRTDRYRCVPVVRHG